MSSPKEKIIHLLERTGPASEEWHESVNDFIAVSDPSPTEGEKDEPEKSAQGVQGSQSTDEDVEGVREMSELSDILEKKNR